jgi:hypothetical protein
MEAVKAANQSSAVGHAAALRKSAAAASAGAGAGAGGAAAKPAQPEVPADPRMQPTNVPAWTYAFKPFSEQGKSVGIGKLLVKVMGAENLPAMVCASATLCASVTLSPRVLLRCARRLVAMLTRRLLSLFALS